MNIKTIALAGVLASSIASFSIRAADAPATPQPEGAGRRGEFREIQNLPADEQAKFKAAMETARKDPKVKEAQEKALAAMKESREALNAAMIAADPSVEPILKKLQEAREKARASRGAPAAQ